MCSLPSEKLILSRKSLHHFFLVIPADGQLYVPDLDVGGGECLDVMNIYNEGAVNAKKIITGQLLFN